MCIYFIHTHVQHAYTCACSSYIPMHVHHTYTCVYIIHIHVKMKIEINTGILLFSVLLYRGRSFCVTHNQFSLLLIVVNPSHWAAILTTCTERKL